MKFSPTDILSQTFSSKLMGYAPEQVDEFLASIANEWARLVHDLERTETARRSLETEVKECRRRERGLHDAMQLAKQVADEIKRKAENDAQNIVMQAELRSERLLHSAEVRVTELRQQILDLQRQRLQLENDLRSTLQAHMSLLEMVDEPENYHAPERGLRASPQLTDECDEDLKDVDLKDVEEDQLEEPPGPASNHSQTLKTAVNRRPETAPTTVKNTKKQAKSSSRKKKKDDTTAGDEVSPTTT